MLCISCTKFSFISLWIPMHAKLLYFYPTTVKYSVLTGSWTSIALDSTACYTNLIFTLADLREICKKKVLGRCGPVASLTETCPS